MPRHVLRLGLLLIGTGVTTAITHTTMAQTSLPSQSILAGSATPTLVARQFKFTEGPSVDKAGNVFFTDQPNDKIWKYSTEGELSVFLEKSGRANGTYFDQQGNLVVCADEHNEIWAIAPDGTHTVLLKDAQGHRLNGPNDLWLHPTNGSIYFTDPYYPRDYWSRTAPDPGLGGQKLYYLPKGQTQPVIADDRLQKPNGIVGTPDGKRLYVADIEANKTYRYRIASDGRLTDRQLFVAQGSDGMTIDNEGNVYLTGKGVSVYNTAGQKIQHIDVPGEWTGNVCFGGKDRKTLFITASEAVFILPMRVHGV
jgi:gluconolactonase